METITISYLNIKTGRMEYRTLEVVYSEKPTPAYGQYVTEVWEQTDTQYIQHWIVQDEQVDTETVLLEEAADHEERICILELGV